MSERGVKGGRARAESLTPERRREISQKAARARWSDQPAKATHTGVMKLGEMECAVLEDGRRVISERGMMRALGRESAGGFTYREREGESIAGELPVFLAPKRLKPFISGKIPSPENIRIPYRRTLPQGGSVVAYGIDASLVPEICKVWIDARAAGALTKAQYPTADMAAMLLHGLAQVGIAALIDEATGYQEERDRRALQAILDRYLRKDLAAWAKKFPDEFYRQIFRLRGWEWKGMQVNRPQALANYTKNLVYTRLAPEILEKLEARTPLVNGRRKNKLHQWLSDDVGHPALAQHLHALIAIMRGHRSWDRFIDFLDVVLPQKDATMMMPFMADDLVPAPDTN